MAGKTKGGPPEAQDGLRVCSESNGGVRGKEEA